MKIIFSGGGTLGSVTPLLAIHEALQAAHPKARFIWVGTRLGPERALVERSGMSFLTLASGKFRRYISLLNVVDIARVAVGFFQSCAIIWQEDPDACISAGGYISVPLHWAAWLFGVPTWIHQQDVSVGLANRLMAPFARAITTALESNVKRFAKRKTSWLGNPVRQAVFGGSREEAIRLLNLDQARPVLLALGGGTGSLAVNQIIVEAVPHLEQVCNIIHLSGKERPQELVRRAEERFSHYHVYQFLDEEMKHAYATADLVVARGGFGTLTELAALGKAAILVPKGGHQEENVQFLVKAGAALFINERTSSGVHLAGIVKRLLEDEAARQRLGRRLGEVLPLAKGSALLAIADSLIGPSDK